MLDILKEIVKKSVLVNIQSPDEYVEEIEAMTFTNKLHWTSIEGMTVIYTEDRLNKKLLRLVIEDDEIYLKVSSDDIYRLAEFSDIFRVTHMRFPIYLYKNMFALTNYDNITENSR